MKKIRLTRNKIAIVDNEDFERLSKFQWNFATVGYAVCRNQYLHHAILGRPPKGKVVDHINGNKLDNRRENLRFATHSQNHANQLKQKNNTSGFRGVSRVKDKWEAKLKYLGKTLHLGRFKKKEHAARKYDELAKKLFGEFAKPNFN